jgi:hypothetical protein
MQAFASFAATSACAWPDGEADSTRLIEGVKKIGKVG